MTVRDSSPAEADRMREDERRFEILAQNAPGVIYLCRNDERYTMLFLNDAVEELTGYPAEDFLSDRISFVDLFHENELATIAPAVNAALARREPYHLRYRIRHRDGHWVWVDENGVGVFDGDELRYLEGFLLDVTDRVKAERQAQELQEQLEQRVADRTAELRQVNERLQSEIDERTQVERALRESETRLQSILDNTTAVVYVKLLNGEYAFVNNQYLNIFDLEREKILGHYDTDIFDEPIAKKLRENDEQVIQCRKPLEFEEAVRHVDGKLHTYISIKFPLFDATGKLYATCGISTDITERIEAAESIRQHRDQLAHVARLSTMGEMAAGLAHELRQPLTSISNYAHGYMQRIEKKEVDLSSMAEVAGRIADQADRAGQIIQKLRDFAKKGEPEYSAVQINDLVRDAARILEHESVRTGVSIQLQLDSTLPTIYADGIQIEQVILNLLRNGIEACTATAVDSQVTITSQIDAATDQLLISVADTGGGANAHQLDHMFDPFFTTKSTGMGMGLNISQTIVEAHDGRLWAEANDTGGLTVFMSLPARTRI